MTGVVTEASGALDHAVGRAGSLWAASDFRSLMAERSLSNSSASRDFTSSRSPNGGGLDWPKPNEMDEHAYSGRADLARPE